MKRVKVILSVIGVMAISTGALAFKAKTDAVCINGTTITLNPTITICPFVGIGPFL